MWEELRRAIYYLLYKRYAWTNVPSCFKCNPPAFPHTFVPSVHELPDTVHRECFWLHVWNHVCIVSLIFLFASWCPCNTSLSGPKYNNLVCVGEKLKFVISFQRLWVLCEVKHCHDGKQLCLSVFPCVYCE